MNSEQPRKPQSDFSQFDDEIEINVSYEEITPEEQRRIKQRAKDSAVVESASAELTDMWLDDEPEIVGSRQQVNSDEIEPEEVLDSSEFEVDEPEPLLDDVATSNKPIDSSDEVEPNDSESELLDTINALDEPVDSIEEVQSDDSESEPLLDDIATSDEPVDEKPDDSESEPLLDDISTFDELLDNSEEVRLEDTNSEPLLDDVATTSAEPTSANIGDLEESPEVSVNEPDTSQNAESEPELIADSWLDETEDLATEKRDRALETQIGQLERQKTTLLQEIEQLQAQKAEISQQTQVIAENLGNMVEEGTKELKERKNNLLIDIEKLERRAERIRQEMRSNFAGASQDLAVRIQGFKEYLVGSLQDLTTAAERLELPKPEARRPSRREARPPQEERSTRPPSRDVSSPQFTEQAFADQTRRIRQLIEKYRTQPDYYGSPWQLRRTFEPIHSQKVQEWFFEQGGRGAIKGMGSRLQNILVASAVISILYRLYRDRCRILVLVDTPEKLGEWRRGLQDCLGISRNDFGTNRGVVLFESADVLVQRADRLLEDKLLPLIIIDETEELINLGLLKFPLWLAFVEKPQPKSDRYFY